MAEITRQTVEKIAQLANIRVDGDEAELYAEQLESILDYIHQLNELDTQDIPQTVHSLPIQNIWREDQVKPGLTQAQAVDGAPESEDGCYRVPRIIE